MNTISTGQPSTLGTYLGIAKVFGPKAEKFIQDKIDDSPNGETEEVLAEETQMLQIFASMM
jgi:hypothetical protein